MSYQAEIWYTDSPQVQQDAFAMGMWNCLPSFCICCRRRWAYYALPCSAFTFENPSLQKLATEVKNLASLPSAIIGYFLFEVPLFSPL